MARAPLFGVALFALLVLPSVAISPGTLRAEVQNSAPSPLKITAIVPYDSPPVYYQDRRTGKATGFAVDIMDKVAKLAGLDVHYVFAHGNPDIIDAVVEGRADIAPGMAVCDTRARVLDFTAPFDVFPIVFHVRSGTDWPKGDAGGRTVGIIRGSVATERLKARQDIRVIPYDSFEFGLFDLLSGKIDAFVCPEPTLKQFARASGVEDRIQSVSPPIGEGKRVIAVRKGDAQLLGRLNAALEGFVGGPEYWRIHAKWYGPPRTWWSAGRAAGVGAALLVAVAVAMGLWRHVSVLRLNRALQTSEARFRTLAEATFEGVVITEKGIITDVSPQLSTMVGRAPGEDIGRPVEEFIAPNDRERVLDHVARGYEEPYEVRLLRSGGDTLPVEVRARHFSINGRTVRVAAIRDISDQKAVEENLMQSIKDKETLIREVHHRVKNNLTVLQSLLKLQSRRILDPEAKGLIDESTDRVRAIALIHESIYRSKDLARQDLGEYIRRLAAAVASGCAHDGASRVSLTVDAPKLNVDIDSMVPCGLIVNELITNAFKHAFPQGRAGEITVTLREIEGGICELRVRDNGVGIPEGFDITKTDSMGMKIVTSLTQQLGGELVLIREGGTEFRITFGAAGGSAPSD